MSDLVTELREEQKLENESSDKFHYTPTNLSGRAADRISELETELLARPTDEQFERIRNAEYEASHRIAELEKKLSACEESRQNLGTERDNLDVALLEFQNEKATLNAENARLRKGIEDAIKHQEIIGGSLSSQGVTVRILKAALEGK